MNGTLCPAHLRTALIMQRMHGSSSSLGTSPKSSGSYWQSNGVSSDAEDVRSSSSANGSMPHLEVRGSLVLPAQLGLGMTHALCNRNTISRADLMADLNIQISTASAGRLGGQCGP